MKTTLRIATLVAALMTTAPAASKGGDRFVRSPLWLHREMYLLRAAGRQEALRLPS